LLVGSNGEGAVDGDMDDNDMDANITTTSRAKQNGNGLLMTSRISSITLTRRLTPNINFDSAT